MKMSQRGKRANRLDNDDMPPTKRRKGRPPSNKTNNQSSHFGAGSSGATSTDGGGGGGNGIGGSSTGTKTKTKSNNHDGHSSHNDGDSPIKNSASQNSHHTSTTSSAWQARSLSDLKLSSIYNRSAPEPPAELFRKDLISAMKLPDSEPLAADEYWVITDQWKQEWERGVQVPVSPDSLPEPTVLPKLEESFYSGRQDFKLPKNKYIRITKDETFSSELHYLSNTPAMAKAACSYDLDQLDEAWLSLLNGERAKAGTTHVSEEQFERVMEELEIVCWEKIQAIMKTEEGLGIEYDENVICDVCRSPDSEEANEMVFCDNCNICVHQACYGITTIPSGQWMCRTCSVGQRPDCVLCPNKGGAMKSTRSGQKWAHVSCALWIPEVSIGSVDRMEPITKISSIPQSRWALICVLCRERVGACIQCSVKPCKTAYHVTCAFQHGLEMRAIIEDENSEDGVKLRSYCQKHSSNKNNNNNKKEKLLTSTSSSTTTTTTTTSSTTTTTTTAAGTTNPSEEDDGKRKKRKDMTTEERNLARVKRLQEIESEFDKHVNNKDVNASMLEIDDDAIPYIYNYWILKRKAANNRPLLPPKSEDVDMITHKQEQADNEKMKMFVHLRQDLERVRNLCYMVSRREKLSRSFFKLREQTFHKQIMVLDDLSNSNDKPTDTVLSAVFQANHGPSLYDRLYSSDNNNVNSVINVDEFMAKLCDQHLISQKTDLNGLNKNKSKGGNSQIKDNHFNRMYLNGTTSTNKTNKLKHSSDIYGSSLSSDDSECVRKLRSATSSESDINDDITNQQRRKRGPTASVSPNKRKSSIATNNSRGSNKSLETKTIDRRKKRTNSTALRKQKSFDSSSEDDQVHASPKSRLLHQMELDMAKEKSSGSESDELAPIRNSIGQHIPTSIGDMKKISTSIYSDSDSTDKDNRTDNTASDSQQHPLRTKAALKEFNSQHHITTSSSKSISKTGTAISSRQKTPDEVKKERTTKIDKTNKTKDKKELERGRTKSKKVQVQKTIEPDDEKISSEKECKKKNSTKGFPTDLLVVPQRQAAKKASENMMRTTTVAAAKKENAKDDEKRDSSVGASNEKDVGKIKDRRQSVRPDTSKETAKSKNKTTNKSANVDANKDLIVAYVPQRQAAKKAAEHIKSGLGKPATDATTPAVLPPVVEEKTKTLTNVSSSSSSVSNSSVPSPAKQRADKKQSSSSSSGTSSSSSSSTSSSSSSSSAESADEEKTIATTTPIKRKSRDSKELKQTSKVKDSPFLNKESKSASSATSDNDSSNSDSESSCSSSDENERETTKLKKPNVPTKAATTKSRNATKQQQQQQQNDIDKKRKSIDIESTSTSKRDESSRSPRVAARKQSITSDRRQSIDIRQGNLAKSPKSRFTRTKSNDVTVNPDDDKKSITTKSGRKRKSIEVTDGTSKSRERISTIDKTKELFGDDDEAIERITSPTKSEKNRTSRIAENIFNQKEGRKSSEFSPKKRETNERLKSPQSKSNTNVDNVGSLEREMADRKAEQKSTAVNSLKASKLSGTLDKLLGKREKDIAKATQLQEEQRKRDESADRSESQNKENLHKSKNEFNIVSLSEDNACSVDMDIEPSVEKQSRNSSLHNDKPIENELPTIDVDAEKPSDDLLEVSRELFSFDGKIDIDKHLPSRQEHFVNSMPKPPSPKLSLFSPLPTGVEKRDGYLFDFNENDFPANCDSLPAPNESSNSLLFPGENMFKPHAESKEESTKETMDLVANLRQNIKKSNNNGRVDDRPQPPVIEIDTSPDSTMEKPSDVMNDVSNKVENHSSEINKKNSIMENDNISKPTSFENVLQPLLQSQQDQEKKLSDPITNANDFAIANELVKQLQQTKNDTHNNNASGQDQQQINVRRNLCVDIDDNQHSPYSRNANKWTEQEMIQTRRSVSSSPSSESESTENTESNKNQQPPVPFESVPMQALHHFPNSQQSQQQTIHHQQQQNTTLPLQNQLNQMGNIPFSNIPDLPTPPPTLIQQNQHIPPVPAQQNPMDYNFTDTNQQTNSPVSLFPPSHPPTMASNIQIPLQSPGVGMFPPQFIQPFSANLSNSQQTLTHATATHHLPLSSKQNNSITPLNPAMLNYPSIPCGAPFTSQSSTPNENALNNTDTASVHPIPFNQIQQTQPLRADEAFVNPNKGIMKPPLMSPASQASISSSPIMTPPTTTIVPNSAASPVGASPNSASKRPQRYNAQQAAISITQQLTAKSPSKSPGKSPRQMEMVRQKTESSRGKARAPRSNNASGRGRNNNAGRGRGRGRAAHVIPIPNPLLEMNALAGAGIHEKLHGTVYDLDFDEDLGKGVENLKAMRDNRRRSIDYRNESFRASSSPKFVPAISKPQRSAVYNQADIRDLRPPSPINNVATNAITATPPSTLTNSTPSPSINAIQTVMPGPVDMRTYNPTYDSNPSNTDAYNSSLLGAFASGIADQTLPDIDEESEKDFQSALKASNSKSTTNASITQRASTPVPAIIPNEPIIRNDIDSITTTTIPYINQTPHAPIDNHQNENIMIEPPKHSLIKLKIKGPLARPENYISTVITDTSNSMEQPPTNSIRRMRKKELLRQYCTQENMDVVNYDTTTEQMPNQPRTGIPKAVDSMSSIPTKDDYKDYATIDTKKRKAGMSRELRQLDALYEGMPERRRSVCSNASNNSSSNDNGKRKGRTKQAIMTTPKLKIKIGGTMSVEPVITDTGNLRPPKKRLANIDVAALGLRKKAKNSSSSSADDDSIKSKKKKKNRDEKRKKKKDKKHKVEIVSSEGSATKLIMRFTKQKTDEQIDKQPIETIAPPIVPIRLKIARNSSGGVYGVVGGSDTFNVTKTTTTSSSSTTATITNSTPKEKSENVIAPKSNEINSITNAVNQNQVNDKTASGDKAPINIYNNNTNQSQQMPPIQMFAAAQAPPIISSGYGLPNNIDTLTTQQNQTGKLDQYQSSSLRSANFTIDSITTNNPSSHQNYNIGIPSMAHSMNIPQSTIHLPYQQTQTQQSHMLIAQNSNLIGNPPTTTVPNLSQTNQTNENNKNGGDQQQQQDKTVQKVGSMLSLSKDCEVR